MRSGLIVACLAAGCIQSTWHGSMSMVRRLRRVIRRGSRTVRTVKTDSVTMHYSMSGLRAVLCVVIVDSVSVSNVAISLVKLQLIVMKMVIIHIDV